MMQIRSRLQELLGPAMRVTAEIASEPMLLPGGKIPLIINTGGRGAVADDAQADVHGGAQQTNHRDDAIDKENAMESNSREMNQVQQ